MNVEQNQKLTLLKPSCKTIQGLVNSLKTGKLLKNYQINMTREQNGAFSESFVKVF